MVEYLNHLIEAYGYYALFVGTFLEGETILVLAGMAASLEHLKLPWVWAVAFAGSLLGDQTFFFIGRFKGKSFLAKRPTWQPQIGKVHRILERHHVLLLLGFRFLYGLRTVIPFVVGSSAVKTSRFIILNVIGAIIWAIVVGTGGYLFGAALLAIHKDVGHAVLIALGVIGILIWLVRHLRQRRAAIRKSARENGRGI